MNVSTGTLAYMPGRRLLQPHILPCTFILYSHQHQRLCKGKITIICANAYFTSSIIEFYLFGLVPLHISVDSVDSIDNRLDVFGKPHSCKASDKQIVYVTVYDCKLMLMLKCFRARYL